MEHRARALALTGLALTVLSACGQVQPATPASGSNAVSEAAQHASASAPGTGAPAAVVLATLPVKGRAPMTGYDRDQFGQPWADVDRNGCDTRDDILRRDLSDPVYKSGTSDCVVLSGSLADPYTATTIAFQRGDGTSVDIDHVVALGDAWQTGAFAWDVPRRTALANDPLNLLAVDYSANRQKGDGDAASWLPSNTGFRCAYVARQVAVKAAYGLWVTQAEHDAMDRVLATCPGEPLPTSGTAAPVSEPAAVPASVPTPAPGAPYANCAAARAAGAAPLHRGDPGYSSTLDGDGDGTACE